MRLALVPAAGLLVGMLLFHTLGGSIDQLGRAAQVLSHPALGWLAVAVACEVVSYLAYAAGQRRLVAAAGGSLRTRWLACLAVSAQALSNFLPAGYLAANVLNFKELRRQRIGAAQSGWILLMSSTLYIGTLAGLTVIGTQVAGAGAPGPVRDLGWAAMAVIGLLLGAFAVLSQRGALTGLANLAGSAIRRLVPGRGIQWEERAGDWAVRLSVVRLSKRALGGVLLLFAACWAADAACLVVSFQAVGAAIPWSSLLMAYCGAQLVSFLPVTPGGLGLVEGSLALGLAAHGLGAVQVLSAVLLYRALSYWSTLPGGTAGYLLVRRSRSGAVQEEAAPASAELPVASTEWTAPAISAAPSST